MKRFIIAALGIATVLAGAGTAHAVDLTLRVTGQTWCQMDTWVVSSTSCPDASGENAILSNATGYEVDVDANYMYDSTSVVYNATIDFNDDDAYTVTTTPFTVGSNSRAVTFTQSEEGSTNAHLISISGALTITAGDTAGEHAEYVLNGPDVSAGTTTLDADASVDADATFTLTSGDADFGNLYIDGGDPDATPHGQAWLDMNGGTLTDPDSMTMLGDSKFDAVGLAGDLTWAGVVVTAEATTNLYETVAEIAMKDAVGFETPIRILKVGELHLTGGTDVGDTVMFKVTSGQFETGH